MANLLVAGILLLAVGAALAYIVKVKKSGTKCIGCPSGCLLYTSGGKCTKSKAKRCVQSSGAGYNDYHRGY